MQPLNRKHELPFIPFIDFIARGQARFVFWSTETQE